MTYYPNKGTFARKRELARVLLVIILRQKEWTETYPGQLGRVIMLPSGICAGNQNYYEGWTWVEWLIQWSMGGNSLSCYHLSPFSARLFQAVWGCPLQTAHCDSDFNGPIKMYVASAPTLMTQFGDLKFHLTDSLMIRCLYLVILVWWLSWRKKFMVISNMGNLKLRYLESGYFCFREEVFPYIYVF